MLAILALFTLTVSCVDPLEPVPNNQSSIPDDALVFSPKVLGITPATKTTLGEDKRGENTVTRLDVFVYKTTGGTVSFHKHYTIGDGSAAINTNVDYQLESNWRLNYTTTDTYRIYAIANINANKLNDPVLPESPKEADLLRLTSESDKQYAGQYGYDCYDIVRLMDDGKHKPFPDGTSDNSELRLNHHTDNKLFLMDGKVDSWQVDETAQKQYFTKESDKSYPLSRAAAKFRVKLNFSDEFKDALGTSDADSLKFTQVTEYWPVEEGSTEEPKPKTVRIITIGSIAPNADNEIYADGTVTGGARAKFANILKATYNVAPEGKTDSSVPTATQQNTFRDENLWDSQNFYEFSFRTLRNPADPDGGYKYPYIDTTYSYAFSWDPGQAAEKAPALAVSIIYTTYIQEYNQDGSFHGEAVSDGGVTNYYRIPLVDITKTGADAVNSIERNYYYQVDALINTMGTSSTEIEPIHLNLKYRVIPWPDAPDEVTEAQTTQLQYFVAETSYRLRGDGAASTQLQYFTPKSDPIASGSPYNMATPKIRNIKVYYINQDGEKVYLAQSTSTYDQNGDYTWSTTDGGAVNISVVPARDKKGGGDFLVSSTSLANRSVRYIEFDAFVDFAYDGGPEIVRHITVTHFPLDNLQSIPGKWSSRWDGQTASGSTTTYYRKKFYKTVGSAPVTVSQAVWAAGIGNNNDDRRNANSAATAVNGYYAAGGSSSLERYIYSGFGGNRAIRSITGYTWNGTRVTISGTRVSGMGGTTNVTWYYDGYDYVVSTAINGDYGETSLWKYTNYYHLEESREESYSPTGDNGTWTSYDGFEWEVCTQALYNATAAENRKVETVKNHPGTGTWVDWDAHTGNVRDDDVYNAKIFGTYYNKNAYTYDITGPNSSSNTANTHTNNHMYIVQISKAGKDQYGNDVILGRPKIDGNNQSQDNVVSPAFMIASQLGATSSMNYSDDNARTAANHCATYMEVAENGYRFTGWRLPTQAEIAYILVYQEQLAGSDVFDIVLRGHYYYTLNSISGQDNNRRRAAVPDYVGGDGNFIRCIRDLTPAEVIELNETGTITPASY